MSTLSTFAVLLFPLLAHPAESPGPSDPPSQEKLVFQNEYVRVYLATLKPGEKSPEHMTGDRMIYSLSSYSLNYQWDGKTSVEKRKAGDFHFHPAGKHAEENPGKSTASFLMVERTGVPLPRVEVTGTDMAKASPFNTSVLFDREMGKVFEVTLPPKDAVSMHQGLHRIVYALTPFELTMIAPDGTKKVEKGKKGSLTWHTAEMHGVENGTGSTIKLLVFAFKR